MNAPTRLTPVQQHADNPVLLQAFRILSDALRDGVFSAEGRLPGERALAQQLGVSRSTLRQVLVALADSGELRRSANRGWFVVRHELSEGPNTLLSFTESTRQRGLTPGSEILRSLVRPATLDEAEILGLAPAAPMFEVERRRTMNDVPVAVDLTCLPLHMVPDIQDADLTDSSLFTVLQESYGLVATRCDYQVQAMAADERIAPLLGLSVGAPVLVGEQTTYDQRERAITTGRVTYRGDAYRFKASLFRP